MKFSLLVPALADVLSGHPDYSTPELAKWLARADQHTSASVCYEQSLLHALGRISLDLAALPGAQTTFLQDFHETAPVNCARADPVHLRAEQDDARLLPVQQINLTAGEAEEISRHLNAHFADEGVSFTIGDEGRWYICGVDDAGLGALPGSQMAGRAISRYITAQAQSARWRQLATEVQMLLHGLDVNERRLARGLLPINALWFWGGGKLDASQQSDDIRLYADNAFAFGLGKLMGLTVFPPQEVMAKTQSSALHLMRQWRAESGRSHSIFLDTRLLRGLLAADAKLQTECLLQLDKGVLPLIRKLLICGKIDAAYLDICDGRSFQLTRRSLLRIWKNSVALHPKPPYPVATL